MSEQGRGIRVRTTSNKDKALRQYEEVRKKPMAGAIVIVEGEDGNVDILGQGLGLKEIMQLMYIAVQGIANVNEREQARAHEVKLDPRKTPTEPVEFEPNQPYGKKREPEIKKGPAGDLIAPPGETFIYCGECKSSQWFVTEGLTGPIARMACVACGNELKMFEGPPADVAVKH